MQNPLTIAAPAVNGTFSAALNIQSLAQSSNLVFQVGGAAAGDQFSVWGAVVSNATVAGQMSQIAFGEITGPGPVSSAGPVPWPFIYIRRDGGNGVSTPTCSVGGQETSGGSGTTTTTVTLGTQVPPQETLSGQPSVQIVGNVTKNLLTAAPYANGINVPTGTIFAARVVVVGKITTPTQLIGCVITTFQIALDQAGTAVISPSSGTITAETSVGPSPWSTPSATSLAVTGAVNNGSGAIRLAFATAGLATGNTIAVAAVGGVPNATGVWTITVIDSGHADLQGSTFAGGYTAGGTVTPQACVGIIVSGSNNIQFQGVGLAPASWQQSQTVALYDFRTNANGIYVQTRAAGGVTSGVGTGPSGTGTGIVDGTATWDYVGTNAAGITLTWTVTPNAYAA